MAFVGYTSTVKVTAYQTPILKVNDHLTQVITTTIDKIPEKSILAVASKVVATTQGRTVPIDASDPDQKTKLVAQEADFYTPRHSSQYNLMLTIKDNWLFVNAGIDESNIDNQYLLWPQDPQQDAVELWLALREYYQLKEFGIILTDSTSMMLNWGVVGHAIGYCGFYPLLDYRGKPDLFGRPMKMSQSNIMQAVAAAAVIEMGEGNEGRPLAVVSELQAHVPWQDRPPTKQELAKLKIALEDDAYAPILTKAEWQRGDGGR